MNFPKTTLEKPESCLCSGPWCGPTQWTLGLDVSSYHSCTVELKMSRSFDDLICEIITCDFCFAFSILVYMTSSHRWWPRQYSCSLSPQSFYCQGCLSLGTNVRTVFLLRWTVFLKNSFVNWEYDETQWEWWKGTNLIKHSWILKIWMWLKCLCTITFNFWNHNIIKCQ